jgi:PAS domain S-box-containing protein
MDDDIDDEQPGVPGHGFPVGGVFKASVDGVVVMSADGSVRDWNPAAEALFGYSHDEAVGRELAGLIIPEALRERHRRSLARFVETGEATIIGRRLELFALRANGSLVQVELTVTIVPDSDPILFAGFVRDQSGGEPLERLP